MLEARVDTRDVERGLAGLLRAGQDVAPLLREAKKPLRSDQRDHQSQQRGPAGPWPRASAATVRKRGRTRSGRARRRKLLGRLPRLLAFRVLGGDALVARSKVPWAAIHQYGGRAGRARIPARVFLYFGGRFVDDFREAMAEYLARGWGRR